MKQAMKTLETGYVGLIYLLAIIAVILFFLITAGIALEVFLRALGMPSIYGLVDFAEASIYAMAMLAAPWIQYHRAHVRVMVLPEALPPRARYILELFTLTVCTVVCAILTYYAFDNFFVSVERDELIFGELIFPEWYLQWQAPVAFLLLAVGFARDLVLADPDAPPTYETAKE